MGHRGGHVLLWRWAFCLVLRGRDGSRPLRGGLRVLLGCCLGVRRLLGRLWFCLSLGFRLWRRDIVLLGSFGLGIGWHWPVGGIRNPSGLVSEGYHDEQAMESLHLIQL